MEASAREYGIFFSFGTNPEIFRRMGEFNNEVGERRFNSQVLIRPQVSRSLCLSLCLSLSLSVSHSLTLSLSLSSGYPHKLQVAHESLPLHGQLADPYPRRRDHLGHP